MKNPAEWEALTGIPVPKCDQQGCCCRGASPSVPAHMLLKQAAEGDDFARNFLSQFVPYATHEEADASVPGIVERTLKAALKSEDFKSPEEVVFYRCRYLKGTNQCQIYEDRPELCRDYPGTPFVVFASGCAFEPWAKQIREKYADIEAELRELKALQQRVQAGEVLDEASLALLEGL